MILKIRKIFLLLFILFVYFILSANAQTFNFRHYGIDEGLPSSEVYQVIQDSKGYIWFATNFGVSRFDGYKFENFDNKDGLPDNTVLEIYEDYKGRIWFISLSAQLSYFQNNKISAFKYNKKLIETIKDKSTITTKSFHVDSADNVYLGIHLKGTFKITHSGSIYQPFYNTTKNIASIYLKLNSDKTGFVESSSYPSISVINKNDTIVFPQNEYNYKGGSSIILYNFNKKNEFLLLYREFIFVVPYFKNKKYNKYSINKTIISSLTDRSGNLWIGTTNGGVFFYTEGRINNQPTQIYLTGESISSIIEDTEHGFWFTTLNNGVFYIPSNKFHSYTTEHGLSDNTQKSICTDNSKLILTATGINNNINILSDSVHIIKIPIVKNIIYCLSYKKNDSSLLIGTNCALYKTTLSKPNNIKCYELYDKPYSVNQILQCSNNVIWLATNIGIFKLENENLSQYTFTKPFFRVASIEEDYIGNIWLGTQNGLYIFQNEKLSYKGGLHKNLNKRITAIKRCNIDSSLWIATKGNGIVILKNNVISELSIKDGLSSTFITCLFADGNVVWAGTNKGVDKIKYYPSQKNKFQIEHINQTKGIISNEVNKIFALNNQIYVLTNSGISLFNNKDINPNSTPPPVYITNIKVINRDTIFLNKYELTHDKNFISISVVGLTYKNPGNVQFKYRLNGLTDKWQFTTTPHIQYQFIPPGDYTFEIYALNEDGIQSATPATFKIIIHAPFWKKLWFFLLIGILFITIVVLIYKYRIREIKAKQNLKDELNRYIQQALTKQMNPHFIFNSLNSIQNYILENDKRQSSKYLSKFAMLMRIILENSQNLSVSLRQELKAINLYLELEAMRFNGKFTFTVTIDDSINQDTEIPALLIQPYIENAIWHGIMHKPEQYGTVTINFNIVQNYLLCTISDDGIGRKKSTEINAQKRKNHKSYGTEITEKRLHAYNALFSTKVDIEYFDLTDENNYPKGTTVKIKIHLK